MSLISGCVGKSSKKRKFECNVNGNIEEMTNSKYDELMNTCIDIGELMRELTTNHTKRCKSDDPQQPINLQAIKDFAKKPFHNRVHKFNKILGLEFSEIEVLKKTHEKEIDRHKDEIKRLKEEIDRQVENRYDDIIKYGPKHSLSQTQNESLRTKFETTNTKDNQLQQTLYDITKERETFQKEKLKIRQENLDLQELVISVKQLLQERNVEIHRLQKILHDTKNDREKLQNENQRRSRESQVLNKQLQDGRSEIERLQKILHDTKNDREKLQNENQRRSRESQVLNKQLQDGRSEIERLKEDIQKYRSTNDDQIKEIDKLRSAFLDEIIELDEVRNQMNRLIKKASDVLPEEFLRKEVIKCQATVRRSKVLNTLIKSVDLSQGNKNDVTENESDAINHQDNISTTIEDVIVEDQDCRNDSTSSMKMNRIETHTTVYNISTSNVNLNTHCTVKQNDGFLSIEPGDSGHPMLTENES